MDRPVIGILSSLKSGDPDLSRANKAVSVPYAYVLSVLDAGGLPLVLPPADGDAAVAGMVGKIDGLLVTGGNDLVPQLYGEEPGWGQGSFSPERDHLDMVSIREAYARGKPVFGICRGIQSVNVCFGGTLYQDIRRVETCTVNHWQNAESSRPSHTVGVGRDSVLYPVLGESALTNSFHHQAVKRVADGFRVGAVAKDGIAEAIEKENGPFVLGVQWHPEQMTAAGDPAMRRLFALFVEACGG